MWNEPHTIMQIAMIIRFVMILAISALGLGVGALRMMLRRQFRQQSRARARFEHRLS
ncbi:MAG TPA: hypothetical protein VFG62_22080 [Rhodopila sp.]|jgi:hypothetical protein|nr:hypothetical protein [Rhodopila sp.]